MRRRTKMRIEKKNTNTSRSVKKHKKHKSVKKHKMRPMMKFKSPMKAMEETGHCRIESPQAHRQSRSSWPLRWPAPPWPGPRLAPEDRKQGHCLSRHECSGNTRQRRCLSHEGGGGNTQCNGSVFATNAVETRGSGSALPAARSRSRPRRLASQSGTRRRSRCRTSRRQGTRPGSLRLKSGHVSTAGLCGHRKWPTRDSREGGSVGFKKRGGDAAMQR